jgi:hypothetical protein
MKTRSAKAKGKRLEQWVRDTILNYFVYLKEDDVRITIGAETASDIKLSEAGKQALPFSIECKNRETFKTLYSYFHQAAKNCHGIDIPLVILKMNREIPLALVDADYLLKLLSERK